MIILRLGLLFALLAMFGLTIEAYAETKVQKVKITRQPVSRTAELGGSVAFTIAHTGDGTAYIQWRFQGQPIAGATTNTYQISSVKLSDTGRYDAVITTAAGSITTKPAVLTVNLAPPALYADNVIYFSLRVSSAKESLNSDGAYVIGLGNTAKDPESPTDQYTFSYKRTARDKAVLVMDGAYIDEDGVFMKIKETYQIVFTGVDGFGTLKANTNGIAILNLPAGFKPSRLTVKFSGTLVLTTSIR
ncbi:MAG: hypothetical protein NTU80_04440 [Verrucomicrobia bacterium]|nr:hypothetical protein [Verrucomicrobiota bacterium]